MAILDIFEAIEIEPSAFEIALQQMILTGLQRQIAETGDFDMAVLNTLGFKRDADDKLVRLTEEEQLATLSPLEQSQYNILKSQAERIEKGGVSEFLKQESIDRASVVNEELNRRGGPGATNLATDVKGLVGFNTPAIQSILADQKVQLLREDEERRDDINRGMFNLREGTGLLANLRTRKLSELTAAPTRFNIGGGGGLLSSLAQQSKFEAESQAGLNQQWQKLGFGLLADLLP